MSSFIKNILTFFLLFLSCFFQIHAESIPNLISNYPNFCKQAADHDEIFDNFKRNPIYRQVLEHIPYELGLLYLDLIIKENPTLVDFEPFRQNDIFGNPITFDYGSMGVFSPTTLRYLKIACDLKKRFGDLSNMHIVEIGGGYGGQCKIIKELCGFASYTIIDLPECIALTKKYLNKLGVQNVYFIDNDHLSEAQSYNLVISNFAFSQIEQEEQKKYFEHIIKPTPNGYMIINFISHYFNLQSLSMEDLIRMLYQNKRQGKVEAEQPCTHSDNLLLTWYANKIFDKAAPKQPSLIPSLDLQTANAITYWFSGGRLGDNFVAYFHAKWLSYKYGLPLLYKSFPYSDLFCLDDRDQREGLDFSFRNIVSIQSENDIQAKPSSTLFVCPYFPETRSEYEWVSLYWLPFFNVEWDDPIFREEVIKCLQPKQPVNTLTLPTDRITIAVHIRRGEEGSNPFAMLQWPLKFIPDDYYIQQIQRLARIFDKENLYIHIFTDDNNPSAIIEKYKIILNNPRITFNYQKETNQLFDFFSIQKFDCCILCQSNFSVIASKLGNYSVLISPVHTVMKNGAPFIDEINLVFKSK